MVGGLGFPPWEFESKLCESQVLGDDDLQQYKINVQSMKHKHEIP